MRRLELHIGRFEEVDDFPWLWEKFQEDLIWERAGYEPLYTQEYMPGNPGMAPKGAKLFDWCMHKFNDVITRQYLSRPAFYDEATLLVEFSRGGRWIPPRIDAGPRSLKAAISPTCRAKNRGGVTSRVGEAAA
jgi:hypothetical protein